MIIKHSGLWQNIVVASAGLSLITQAGSSSTSSSYNVTIPAGPAIGDLIIAVVGTGDYDDGAGTWPTVTVPSISGYTLLASSASEPYHKARVYYKVISGTVDTSLAVTNSGSNPSSCSLYVLRGVNSTPFDVTTITATSASFGTFDAGAITPVTSGAWVLDMGFGVSSLSTFSNTVPTGYLSLQRSTVSVPSRPIYAGSVISYKPWSGSGAENPGAYSPQIGSIESRSIMFTVAIRPA